MNYQTIIQKGQDGWNAKSEAVLGETPEGSRILRSPLKTLIVIPAEAGISLISKDSRFRLSPE